MAQNYWSQNCILGRPQVGTYDWHLWSPACHCQPLPGVGCHLPSNRLWDCEALQMVYALSIARAFLDGELIRVGHFHVWMIGWLTHVFYLYCRNSKPGMFLSLQSFVGHVPFPYHHASRPPANYNPIRKSAGTLNRWLGEKSGVKSNGLRSSHPRQRGKLR